MAVMTNLTKLEAHLIAGNGYRLVDAYGNQFEINSTHEICFTAISGLKGKVVKFDKIGTDYHVLCHPLSRLTTEIEWIGVPIVELAKLSYPNYEWTAGNKNNATSHQEYFEYDNGNFFIWQGSITGHVWNQQQLFRTLEAWHFDTMHIIERGIGKEINLK